MPIRQVCPPEDEFVSTFQDSVIPSAIPNEAFIDWNSIEDQIQAYEEQIEAIQQLAGADESEFRQGVADALMSAEDTREWIDFYFELLGERGNKYSALEGLWRFYDTQRAIDAGDRDAAEDLAGVLQDIGLQYVVEEAADVRDHYRGMLVGMETHSRKNRQGTCFEDVVEEELETIVERANAEGFDVELDDQYVTKYDDKSGQAKTVDFALFEGGEPCIVFEANCYKSGGSKPSEIRRSYNRVASRMRADGIEFVWITDGQAWEKPLTNVLRQSYNDIVDVYNLDQVSEELGDDVIAFLNS